MDGFVEPRGHAEFDYLLHGVRNDGPEPAEFVVVWGPPGTGMDGPPGTGMDWGAARMGLLSAAALDRQTPDTLPDPPEGTR